MPRKSSNLLFAATLVLALALLCWWTVFQLRECRRLERMAEFMQASRVDEAARAMGASDAAHLADLARRRRTMFLSEGIVFGIVLAGAGLLYWTMERREARIRADHDRFLTGTTHELKTPLATIRLLLESLRDERLPSEKRLRYIDSGLLEADRLEGGLTNVLTAAGLRSAGRKERPVHPGDLADDVRRAVEAMENRATAAGVRLVPDLDREAIAPRDPEAVQLVLRNLLENAVKYSPSGSTVRVALSKEKGFVEIRVEDHGKGMDQDELRQAFAPFWRGRDASTGGSGLGLHVVRELVLAHGGSVRADSRGPGKGSVFTVRLPAGGGPARTKDREEVAP
ncbi:MAG: hypothetical protein Fur0037_11670 [Planctomycetota bacterium]